jgi:hypothetical protein
LPKYHKQVKDWDMEDNYDFDISNRGDANYPKTFLYDDA